VLCSAKPSNWGEELDKDEFQRLKNKLRTMWSRAAETFVCSYDEVKGHGLKVNNIIKKL
jgi:hypothetical protein